jgi:DNA-binding response OmpR family regulator
MKKTGRLDEILIRLGYCNEEQIIRALKRQKKQGGRLGLNLLALGVISEDQLLNALSEQYRIPTLLPEERALRQELVSRMPQDVVADGLALPLSWNEAQKILSVATSNPGDLETLRRVKDAFAADTVRIALAPDGLLRTLGSKLIPRVDSSGKRKIVLPELFAADPTAGEASADDATQPPRARVLMITAAVSRKNVMPSVFQREGYDLTVACNQWEAADALKAGTFERVLLSQEMADAFSQWVRVESFPSVDAEVVVFPSVSHALLENPIGYESTYKSLQGAVQALADVRSAQHDASPPYGLIATDVEALGERVGLRRIARDGMHLGLHLLLPGNLAALTNGTSGLEPFGSFASSLELASRLQFPWKLDTLLVNCHSYYSGRLQPGSATSRPAESLLAAQVVAIAWFRHNHVEVRGGSAEERMVAVRTALRSQAGRLASPSLIETYVRLITERGGVVEDVGDRQVMLIGAERIASALTQALQRLGRETIVTADLVEAQKLSHRRAPAAIVIDHKEFPDQLEKFSRVARLGGASLLFVLTDSPDPALMMGLLELGVDDVFGPPHDFGLVAARINRAIRGRSRDRAADKPQSGQFSARFDAFSFVELIQMLGHGLKNVRIDLSRTTTGDRAVVFMERGRLTHATFGEVRGEPAVFRVLSWEDDGEFTVREEAHLPPATIQVSTAAVLTEGLKFVETMKK